MNHGIDAFKQENVEDVQEINVSADRLEDHNGIGFDCLNILFIQLVKYEISLICIFMIFYYFDFNKIQKKFIFQILLMRIILNKFS